MTKTVCPDQPTLQRMLQGQISGERASELEAHLSTCDRCIETAGRLVESDELIDAARAAGQQSEDDDSVSRLIQQLKAAQADSLNTQLDDTHVELPDSSEHEHTLELVEDGDQLTGELSFLDPPDTEGGIGRLGRFRVLEILGRGGMGVVLKAEDTQLKRDVAIKVLNISRVDKSDATARFLREAQATAAIEHDNIVTIHDVGEQHGMPYYAMQFLRGESLSDRLRSDEKLPITEAVRIAREIAQGLAAAHEKGLLHRDIKPANVWLEEGTDRAKIVDFGLARIDDHDDTELTNSGAILGTPKYMSPEQAQGQTVDHRCDLFSLGSVLFHLVAGEAPFSGTNVTATLIAVASGEHADIRALAPECPEALKSIIDRLLEKSADDRYATADEVVAALQAVEDELFVVAPPLVDSVSPKPSSSGRRGKPVVWMALAGVILLLILLGVVFLWRTPYGTLRVKVDDPNLEVWVDGDEIKLTDKTWKGKKRVGKRRLQIKVGDQWLKIDPQSVFRIGDGNAKHRLSVELDDTVLSSNEFEIVRDKETILSISLVDVAAELTPNGTAEKFPPSVVLRDGVISPEEGAVELVPLMQPEHDALNGEWNVDGKGLRCAPEWAAKCRFPVAVDGAYELEVDCTHLSGSAGLVVMLPVGSSSVDFYPASSVNRLGVISGLSDINGEAAKVNGTARGEQSTIGYRFALKIRVQPDGDNTRLTVWKDDNPYREWTLSESTLSQPDIWRMPASDQLGVGASSCELLVHAAKLRMLSGEARMLRRDTSSFTPETIQAEDDWVDLLSIIDVEADSEEGGWQRDERGVIRVEQEASTLRVPAEIHGNYELRLKFLRDDEEKSGQGLVLPIGPPPYTVHPQFFSFGEYHGLSLIRGHRITSSSNPTKRKLARKAGQEYEAVLKVVVGENDSVEITCHLDGEELYTFKGLLKDLNPTSPEWLRNNIALRSGGIPGARWTNLELRMLDGHAKLLRPTVNDSIGSTPTDNSQPVPQPVDLRINREIGKVEGRATSLAVSPDGRTIAVGLPGGKFQWLDSSGEHEPVTSSTDASGSVNRLRFSPDGKRLFVCPAHADVHVFDGQTKEHIAKLPGMLDAAISPQGELVIGHGSAGKAMLYNAVTLKTQVLPPSFDQRSWWKFAFLDEQRVAGASVGDEGGMLTIVNLATGEFEVDLAVPSRTEGQDFFSDVGITGNGRFVMVGHARNGIKVFDLQQKEIVAREQIVSIPQFDPRMPQGGGALFAYGQRVFSVHGQTGQIQRIREKDFWHVALTDGGRQLIAVNKDGAINVWDVLYFPPLDESGSDSADANGISISTGGLIEEEFITSVGNFGDRWRTDGEDLVEIQGQGELRFPALGVTEFAMEMDITIRDPLSDLLIVHKAPQDAWRSEVRLAHTEPDDDGKLLRVLPMRRQGGRVFMPGHTNAPVNEEFRLTLAVGNDGLCLYINGQRRLIQNDVQPYQSMNFTALSDSADATVHRLEYRPLSGQERLDLDMPGFKVTSESFVSIQAQTPNWIPIKIERFHKDEDVRFTLTDLPDGVCAPPITIEAGSTSRYPGVYAMGNVAPGKYDVSLVGKMGEFELTTPITLEITEPDTVTPLTIPTNGLGDVQELNPAQGVQAWKREGVFAEIKGKGAVQFPRLPVDQFLLVMEMEIRNAESQLTIAHDAPRGRWRSVVEVAHAKANDGGVTIKPIRRNGGRHYTPGGFSAPLGKRFVLTIAAKGEALACYVNGVSRRYQVNTQPELHLTFSAASEDADVTIYSMRYIPLPEFEDGAVDVLPADVETDESGLYLGEDWPRPSGENAYDELATGKWERIELTDAQLKTWETESAGKLTTKRLPNGDVEVFGDHNLVVPGYTARNTIFRVELEPKWSDDGDYISAGVRYVKGFCSEAMMKADGEFKLYAGRQQYMTSRQFNGRYRGTCELAIAAFDNWTSGYVNGQLVATSTKWSARVGPPALDLSAGAVIKRMEVMVLSETPTGISDAMPREPPPAEPEYEQLATGEWQPVEFTDELVASWKAVSSKSVRFFPLEDGGLRVMGPHTEIFEIPGYEGKDVLVRARLKHRFRFRHSFVAIRTRRERGLGYAVSLHPEYEVRAGYDFPRWHEVCTFKFSDSIVDEVELVMASVGPWQRGYLDGREIISLTNWQYDAGAIALQTRGCVDYLSLEVMSLDDADTLSAIRQRFAREREEAAEIEPPAVAESEPINPWPRPRGEPEYAGLASGKWQTVEVDEALRRRWEDESEGEHFTRQRSDGGIEFIGWGANLRLPDHLAGKNVLLRAELTQYWGEASEWVLLGARQQEDGTYVGSHLSCGGKLTTGNFPLGRWALVKQEVFDELYDGRIEMVVATVDEDVITYINGKKITSFPTKAQDAGGLLLRHDGPFVLHKLEYMNLDDQGEE